MTAVIAICKCSHTKKLFGIRFEKSRKDWIFTWAFPVDEKSAQNEQYDKTSIVGDLLQGEEYPGCPHCKNMGFYYCSCGKLNCWNGRSQKVTCKWCGGTGYLGGSITNMNITGNF